jgi:20S proteasome alpha/beta subunit
MTIVAWDGKTLAADRQLTSGNTISSCKKLFRLDSGEIVGMAGEWGLCLQMLHWLSTTRSPETFPEFQKETEAFVQVLVITPKKEIFDFGRSPYPTKLEDKFAAIGSGAPYALALMSKSFTAKQAVTVACRFDPNCGQGIDTIQLK